MNDSARWLRARHGTPEWDAVLRATGVVALLAIYPTTRWPDVAGLVGFLCLTLFVSGPISIVLPAAFEPMLMVAGRIYHPPVPEGRMRMLQPSQGPLPGPWGVVTIPAA